MSNSRIKYIGQEELSEILEDIEVNSDRLDMMIAEVLASSSCDPKHLVTEKELAQIKTKFSDII